MKLTFILVGKIKEHFYEEGIKMYIKRISKYSQVEFINLDESRLSTSTSKIEIDRGLDEEAEKMYEQLHSATSRGLPWKKEHEAMREVIGDLVNQEEFLSLLFEFDEKKTKEAIFAHHCDKLEADIQAKVYQDMGCQHPLDEQENNVVFKSNKVQQMVKDGAQTAFDIWYEWDKSLYYDDEDFARLLDYVRTINTQELLK